MITILETLDELGVEYREHGQHHHVTQGWVGIDCPFCSPHSGGFRCGLSLMSLRASCWVCGWHPVSQTIAEAAGVPEFLIRKLLDGLQIQEGPPVKKRGKLILPKGVGPLLPAHRSYLKQRGLKGSRLSRLWGIGGIGVALDLPWRVFIPITLRGEVVSWTTRSIGEVGRRYLSAEPHQEAINHKHLLFGEDLVRHAVIICEGPFDAMTIGPGAVATFGVDWTQAQLNKILKYPIRVIAFDNEPEAQNQARKLCDQIAVFPGKTIRVVVDGKDVADSKKDAKLLRKLYLD